MGFNLANVVTIPGILSFLITLSLIVTLPLITVFITEGSFYVEIFAKHYGWSIVYEPLLIVSLGIALTILIGILTGNELVDRLGKLKTLVVYAIATVLLIICGTLIAVNASKASNIIWKDTHRLARYVVATIFVFVDVILYLGLILLTVIYK
ncbi:unnamed protein product, partial [Mesorhabditis spiculigera]